MAAFELFVFPIVGESIPLRGRLIRNPGFPRRDLGLKEEIGLWNQGGGKG